MLKATSVILAFLLLAATASGGDLYRVWVTGPAEALRVKDLDVDVVMPLPGGYLLLSDSSNAAALGDAGLTMELLARHIERDQIVMDGRMDRRNAGCLELLYEDDRLRLYRAETSLLSLSEQQLHFVPLADIPIEIRYRPESLPGRVSGAITMPIDLTELMSRIEEDSLESYTERLQAFGGRLTGTTQSVAARDWLADKFREFGYDSVVIDPFTGAKLWSRDSCDAYNVIACKPGVVYPEQEIIFGAHYDAVPGSPGADDNASGTAAVLEVARALKDVPMAMTLKLVTFDSEESGLLGAYHYLDDVIAENRNVVAMFNADMIGHYRNTNRAKLYTGDETRYAELWADLAGTYAGIDDVEFGGMAGSDHLVFQRAGYDVVFVQEGIFSDRYHSISDSTTYMNFEYMTRMVKTTIGMVYTAIENPPPVDIAAIEEPGDGLSQIVHWRRLNPQAIATYRVVYFPLEDTLNAVSIDLSSADTSLTLTGLTEGLEYEVVVQAFDTAGGTSLVNHPGYFVPQSRPEAPWDARVLPLPRAVHLEWAHSNTELDFSHFAVFRDNQLIAVTPESMLVDDDPDLGNSLHEYQVFAVDTGGTMSSGFAGPAIGKAATLATGRILAVNRTQCYTLDFVDEVETGVFMREALSGYDFDYFSDTAAILVSPFYSTLSLNDAIDYEVVVVGAETAHHEDLAVSPAIHGVLDSLSYYLSIGGKLVLFGRWGFLGSMQTSDYLATTTPYDDGYHDFLHIKSRTQTRTLWDYGNPIVPGDLIGARTTISTYPSLPWDSLRTLAHATSQDVAISEVGGIPCATFVEIDSTQADIIYRYQSRDDSHEWDGQPVAWRHFGPDYDYICFDVPLSMMHREAASEALRQAVDELLAGAPEPGEPVDDPGNGGVPGTFLLSQNYPNPFNDRTSITYGLPFDSQVRIDVFNILGQHIQTLVNRERVAGTYPVEWDGTNRSGETVATGVYFYRLRAGSHVETRKMLLLK